MPYKLEQASEEAEAIKRLVEKGKASDYKTAEKIIDKQKAAKGSKEAIDLERENEPDPHDFNSYSPQLSRQYAEELKDLATEAERFPEGDGKVNVLASKPNTWFSAQASSSFGLIGMKPEVIKRQDNLTRTMLYHERTHIRVGAEIKRMIMEKFPEIEQLWHDVILPQWVKTGSPKLELDDNFFNKKMWLSLFPEDNEYYYGKKMITIYQTAVNDYFRLLKKDLLQLKNGRFTYVPSKDFKSFDILMQRPDQDLEKMFQQDPAAMALKITTGYELADVLTKRHRDRLSLEKRADLWEIEEGFANFVACSHCGMDIDELDKWHKQDQGNVLLAKKIMYHAEKQGINAEQAIKQVNSYNSLYEFYNSIMK